MVFQLSLKPDQPKSQVIDLVTKELEKSGLTITAQNTDRPWGAGWEIDEAQVDEFIDKFFPGDRGLISNNGSKLSPKVLLVAPNSRLSWQYHDRRQELWKVLLGPIGYYLSHTDQEPASPQTAPTGKTIKVGRTERHRLAGLDNWALVAEVWSHTDPSNPSDEDDKHRLQDDYGR